MATEPLRDLDGVVIVPGDTVLWFGRERFVVSTSHRSIQFEKVASSWTSPDNPCAWYAAYEPDKVSAGLKLVKRATRATKDQAKHLRTWYLRSEKQRRHLEQIAETDPKRAQGYARFRADLDAQHMSEWDEHERMR